MAGTRMRLDHDYQGEMAFIATRRKASWPKQKPDENHGGMPKEAG